MDVAALREGDPVVFRGIGVGRVVGHDLRPSRITGEPELHVAMELSHGRKAWLPHGTAGERLRLPVTRAEAEELLAALRAADVAADARPWAERSAEFDAVAQHGTAPEQAALLRRLYADTGELPYDEMRAILVMEDPLLDEISLVLAIPRETLVAELRERYPAFAASADATRKRSAGGR
jgi:RNA polymerase-interacting CarD/CdnL/TRCF family regulator